MHDKPLIIQFRVISKRINNFSFVESDFFLLFTVYRKTKQRSVVRIIFILFRSFSLSSIDGRSSLFFFVSFCAPIRSIYVCVEFFLFLFLLLCIVYCLPVHELTFFVFFSMSVFFFSLSFFIEQFLCMCACVCVCVLEKNKLFSE